MSGEITKYKSKINRHEPERKFVPACLCKDFNEETGRVQAICCVDCGRVWVGFGELNRSHYKPSSMVLDLNYLKEHFPEAFEKSTNYLGDDLDL